MLSNIVIMAAIIVTAAIVAAATITAITHGCCHQCLHFGLYLFYEVCDKFMSLWPLLLRLLMHRSNFVLNLCFKVFDNFMGIGRISDFEVLPLVSPYYNEMKNTLIEGASK